MAKRSTPASASKSSRPTSSAAKSAAPKVDSTRETIESIVVALVLAFLFRAFEAEGFAIPTGSMAPTLMGRHKDFNCPQCGFLYQVGASQEVDDATGRLTGIKVVSAICPMCRFPADIGEPNPQDKAYRSYGGDRIQAAKFTYFYDEPRRWDVTLFKYPHGAETNFIKRLVGMPNETLRVWHGDLHTKPDGQQDFTIERKPPIKVQAMLQEVYDNDYVDPKLIERGWPARWQPRAAADEARVRPSDDFLTYQLDGTAELAWLAYEHTPPSWADWQVLAKGPLPAGHPRPKPQLISDFCAYNTGSSMVDSPPIDGALMALGLHWVPDLAIETDLETDAEQGAVLVELISAGHRYQARLDLATGEAVLSSDGQELAKAPTELRGGGEHNVSFANVDKQLLLWIDGDLVEFSGAVAGGVPYAPPSDTQPTVEDLQPVRIGVQGAKLTVGGLKVRRDVYYIVGRALQPRPTAAVSLDDYTADNPLITALYDHLEQVYAGRDALFTLQKQLQQAQSQLGAASPQAQALQAQILALQPQVIANARAIEPVLRQMMSDPGQWSFFEGRQHVDFVIGPSQFLMFGDNSGGSSDSRVWRFFNGQHPELVDRDLLIGKAMFVYWPHAWETPWSMPLLWDVRVPFYPNFPKFRLVH